MTLKNEVKMMKKVVGVLVVLVMMSCSSDDDVQEPKYLDQIVGKWLPVVGYATGEYENGEYGDPAFTYFFNDCRETKGGFEFFDNGNFEFSRSKGKLEDGCVLVEESKSVRWEAIGDSTFTTLGTITQLTTDDNYVEKSIEDLLYEPYLDIADKITIEGDTLVLFFDKINNEDLYLTRFVYARVKE